MGRDRRLQCLPHRGQRSPPQRATAHRHGAHLTGRRNQEAHARRMGARIPQRLGQSRPRLHHHLRRQRRSAERRLPSRGRQRPPLGARPREGPSSPTTTSSLVGPFRPTWQGTVKRAPDIRPEELAGWDSPILPRRSSNPLTGGPLLRQRPNIGVVPEPGVSMAPAIAARTIVHVLELRASSQLEGLVKKAAHVFVQLLQLLLRIQKALRHRIR